MISLTSPVKTRAHDWPAGLKFTGLCIATVGLFNLQQIISHAVIFILVILIYASVGTIFLRAGMRGLRLLWPFVVVILIWHAITNDMTNGTVIVLRMMNAFAIANLVTMVTRLDSLMDFLGWMLVPLQAVGVSTKSIQIAVVLVVRFIPLLYIKSLNLIEAWRARSVNKPRWRLITPITVLALDDADYVAEALKARGGIELKKEKL